MCADKFEPSDEAVDAASAVAISPNFLAEAFDPRGRARIRAQLRAAYAIDAPRIRREALEEAAKIALAEEMTGTPPLDWDTNEQLSIAYVTMNATKKVIAASIRALMEK